MGRPRGSAKVTVHEVTRILALFITGMRLLDIGKAVGRGEATIARAVRGLKRKRPPPPRGRHAARNDRILALVESGKTHAQAARRFALTPRTVGLIVAAHPRIAHLLRRWRPAKVAARFRLELSTVQRIATGRNVERDHVRLWG